MSNSRSWAIGAAVMSLVLAVAGWFLLISPVRGSTATTRASQTSEQAKNVQLKLAIDQLKAEFATLPSKQAELAAIKQQMPNNPGLPTLIRSLSTIAKNSGATLVSIAPGTPTALSAASSFNATPTAASATASTVQAIPVTIIASGTYAENELFLQQVQNSMTRIMLVNGLTIAPGTKSGSASTSAAGTADDGTLLQTTINGQIFMLPVTSAASTSTTASGTSATGASKTPTTGSAS
jgi:Tfp pilus assembly protein PilO